MFFSVDRIEGTNAILVDERGKTLEVPLAMLPLGLKQGEMLLYQNKNFYLAPKKTAERRETMANVLSQLLKHGNECRETTQADTPKGEINDAGKTKKEKGCGP